MDWEVKIKKIPDKLYVQKAKGIGRERLDFKGEYFYRLKVRDRGNKLKYKLKEQDRLHSCSLYIIASITLTSFIVLIIFSALVLSLLSYWSDILKKPLRIVIHINDSAGGCIKAIPCA